MTILISGKLRGFKMPPEMSEAHIGNLKITVETRYVALADN